MLPCKRERVQRERERASPETFGGPSAMRSSPPCSAGAAGALGYLENINDSKQPEELPGESDASRSMEQGDLLRGARREPWALKTGPLA
ncbi:hypothetical protein QQF64_014783 [Cirrhinus molitorella]|uniref:Uncharacterized protein n=1 Tax=Cirrhinus molitorella TaxID=172907 RepID=A0ABR3NT45_9TELE